MLNKNLKLYEKYMRRCIKLAQKGEGKVSPNPFVGAVLLDKNLNFVSEGWHKKIGEAHAEVNAINSAKEKNIDISGGTIIVNLEPCSHQGKTPPCADLIIKSGLKRVVAGCMDPDSRVAGSGIKKCKNAGLEVITGVLEDECVSLNEIFFKNKKEKAPFLAIKSAVTLDGKIATKTGSSKWITGEKARKDVQKLRNKYDAILTSSETILKDDPSLTCRMKNGRNPVRIVIDSHLKISPSSKVYQNDGTRVIIASVKNSTQNYSENVEIWMLPEKEGHVDLQVLSEKLIKNGIFSVLVEAGGILNGAFLKEQLVDKLYLYTAPKILGDNGGKSFADGFDIKKISDCTNLKLVSAKKLGSDFLTEFTMQKERK